MKAYSDYIRQAVRWAEGGRDVFAIDYNTGEVFEVEGLLRLWELSSRWAYEAGNAAHGWDGKARIISRKRCAVGGQWYTLLHIEATLLDLLPSLEIYFE